MRRFIKILGLISFGILSYVGIAEAQNQSSVPQTLEQLKMSIEEIRKNTNTPAVGIALVGKDGPYWIAGLGEADREKHIQADENTMFRIGSVSKMFVALSVMKLADEGKLHLTDELKVLAPEIKFENKWEKTNPILLAHLLEHTTGWDDLHLAEIGFKATDKSLLIDALNYHPDSRRSRWVPGTRHGYTNIGPAVSAYIVEKVTGKKFEDYVQENFLNPLQMTTSTFYHSKDYDVHGAKLYMNNEPIDYSYPLYRPSGTMNSSAKEMANLIHFYIQRGKFNNIQILSPESIQRMEIPKTTLGASAGVTAGYGLHNTTSGHSDYGVAFHGHTGGIPGALTVVKYSPEIQAGYVVFTNTMGPAIWQISDLVDSYLLKDVKKFAPKSVAVSPKLIAAQGIYVRANPSNEILRFVTEITDSINLRVSDNKIHRSPLAGGWQSDDIAIAENLAVNPWSGLPSIALVKDPLLGEVLQVEENTYKRTPAFLIYGKIALIISLITLSILNILFALIWIPRLILGNVGGASLAITAWSFISSLTLCATFAPAMTTHDVVQLGTLSATSLSLFIGSMLYPIVSLFSLISLYKYKNEPMNKLIFANTAILTLLHIFFVAYLAYYGIIGYRSWID